MNSKTEVRFTARGNSSETWLRLKRYRDIDYVAKTLMSLHEISSKHKNNVRKQAEQISFSLLQSEEYWRSASKASIATSPLLYYYSILAMALAELLWKQSGEVSLDKARSEHGHHGLDIRMRNNSLDNMMLSTFWAKQHFSSEIPRGTFELWRRSARQLPMHATVNYHFDDNSSTSGVRIMFEHSKSSDRVEFPREGLSLLTCFKMLPTMTKILAEIGIRSSLARSYSEIDIHENPSILGRKGSHYSFVLHPCPDTLRDDIIQNMRLDANYLDCITVRGEGRRDGGLIVNINPDEFGYTPRGTWPDSFPLSKREIWIPEGTPHLNEFGYFYVGLFICGMISRYYPDIWMREIASSSASALAVASFMEQVSWRVPMLLLGELSGSLILLDE